MPPKAGPSRGSASSGATNYGSLTDIVSSLTRAQVGSAATSVADDELDKRIAEMLLKEAKQKDKMWGERGTRAYYDPDKEKCVRSFWLPVGRVLTLRVGCAGPRPSASRTLGSCLP